MANLQDVVLEAVDTIVSNRIEQIATDKTVTATVAGCTNSLTGEYLVSYNGGKLKAYAQEGNTYTQGQSVYVLVPEGDFTKKKNIVGVAQAAEDDNNISFVSSAISNYNLIGRNCLSDKNKVTPAGLRSYKKEDYKVLYKKDEDVSSSKPKFLSIDTQELENNIKQAEAVLIEASFRTSLPREHKLTKTGEYGITFILAFKDGDATDDNGQALVKKLSYTIDSNSMTGSPLQYQSYFDQYQIFPIDVENFLYIDQIIFYCKDFVEATDQIQSQDRPIGWGDDIFVKDVEFYGLRKISAANGDYQMHLSMPKGSTFRDLTENSSLSVVSTLRHKNEDLSGDAMYYWFKEDGRVTASSKDYKMYGGAGWSYLEAKGNKYSFVTTGAENRAYENKYMCVCVYKEQMVLKDYFVLYNEAAKRDIEITSSLGVSFSFDRGEPTLTCLLDGKDKNFEAGKANGHPDSYFRFVWSKVDDYGQTLSFVETVEELKARYEEGIKQGIGYNNLSALKNQMNALEGASWSKNTLTYPVKGIDSKATFKCAVYLRDREPTGEETVEDIEYGIGTATITLKNATAADPTDYYITIENGDQVFQYSESGVSPDDDRYEDPLEVKPLTCHFFDPAGLEVNKDTYDIKWRVPLTDSLITIPKEGMVLNQSNQKIEYCTSQIYPMAIAANFDYSAVSNQIEAIVTYQGVTYSQMTDFLFTKVGENGTNGTDIVAKISPTSKSLKNKMLALVIDKNNKVEWNTGQSISQQVLQFQLYQRNEKINDDSTVSWSMGYGQSKYMSCNDGVVSWDTTNAAKRKFMNQIVKAQTTYTVGDTSYKYYAFYGIPVIKKYADNDIQIDKTSLLKSITYNADGRNPLYNKNQGVTLVGTGLDDLFVEWIAEGGEPSKAGQTYDENPLSACFKIITEKNTSDGVQKTARTKGLSQIYILPNDVYDGEYGNNLIHCKVYTSADVANPIVELYIPIYMSLNTYGLKSLNDWDGTHLEINEDENYILAPQIGAGEKNKNNQFTGVVMGTSKTYDSNESQIGLMGFSEGKQSIFLDAKDGSATFGLPEQQASQNNHFEEGRIKLVPGGESYIGAWRIGSRALYNIANTEVDEDGNFTEAKVDRPYTDYPVKDSQFSIPSDKQGLILGANPAYISVKGKPLTKQNSNIDFDGANAALAEGDSLEVEIDPRKDSTFSIYRHYKKDDKWHRYPLVGINQFGQFYTNAIQDQESSMGIGKIGAFGKRAFDAKYIGAQFGWSDTNLFKFFVDGTVGSSEKATTDLYLSTGTNVNNEYPRGFNVYGKHVSLYAPDLGKESSDSSTHRLHIDSEQAIIGHENSYLRLSALSAADDTTEGKTKTSVLYLNNNFEFMNPKDRKTTMSTGDFTLSAIGSPKDDKADKDGNYTYAIGGNLRLNATNSITNIADKNFQIKAGEDYFMNSKAFSSIAKNDEGTFTIGANDAKALLTLNDNTGQDTTLVGEGLKFNASNNGVKIVSDTSPNGIKLLATAIKDNEAQGGVSISLVPQSGGNGAFYIRSGTGSIESKYDEIKHVGKRTYVSIGHGIVSNWGTFLGTPDSQSTTSIIAERDIRSINGWNYSNEYCYNNGYAHWCMGANRSSSKVSEHLGCIYDLLNNLQTQISNEVSARQTGVQQAKDAAAAAKSAAKTAQETADGKVDKNHTHTFAYGTVKVVGHKGGDADTTVVDIINTSNAGSHRVVTSTAQ
nr:MAG TPA: hypothetical protein [Caudoviricetes sp.]